MQPWQALHLQVCAVGRPCSHLADSFFCSSGDLQFSSESTKALFLLHGRLRPGFSHGVKGSHSYVTGGSGSGTLFLCTVALALVLV